MRHAAIEGIHGHEQQHIQQQHHGCALCMKKAQETWRTNKTQRTAGTGSEAAPREMWEAATTPE